MNANHLPPAKFGDGAAAFGWLVGKVVIWLVMLTLVVAFVKAIAHPDHAPDCAKTPEANGCGYNSDTGTGPPAGWHPDVPREPATP